MQNLKMTDNQGASEDQEIHPYMFEPNTNEDHDPDASYNSDDESTSKEEDVDEELAAMNGWLQLCTIMGKRLKVSAALRKL